MLDKVEVRTAFGTLLTLPIMDYSQGYATEDIQGLDPVKATLVSSGYANLDGEQYQTSKREKRNLVFVIGLEPDYVSSSVRDLRNNLYKFFMPKSEVSLRFFMLDGLVVDIVGRVETFDAPLFVKEPKATISLLCFESDFVDLNPVTVFGNTVSDVSTQSIDYAGSIETGFVFRMNINRTLTAFSIDNILGNNTQKSLDFAAPLVAGDVLEISTVARAKRATLTRGGSSTSVLYGVAPYSDWINLFTGANQLRVSTTGAAIPWSLVYNTRYGGL